MLTIILLIIINFAFTAFAIRNAKRKNSNLLEREIIKHVGILELAWSVFSIMGTLYITFIVLGASSETSSFLAIAGALKVTQLIILTGFGIFHFFISSVIFLKLLRTDS